MLNCNSGIKLNILMCSMLFLFNIAHGYTEPTIDLYKSKQISLLSINDKFGKDIKKLAKGIYKLSTTNPNADTKTEAILYRKVIFGIKKLGDFSYVGISPIMYPGEDTVHVTIDVVDKDDDKRNFKFLPSPTGSIADPDNLIQNWQAYQKVGLAIPLNKFPTYKVCPANHCIFGFEDSRLKKYGPIFNNLVPINKNVLIKMLREDKNPDKRTSAAYLLAHIKNSKELIKILLPSIYDSNGFVRNAVMRVIAATVFKNKISDFPIDKVLAPLDFPETTDRNKALLIIMALVQQPKYAVFMKKHGLKLLINQLKLSQPNLHDSAYEILKKISNKNYLSTDFAAWVNWANNQNIS